MSDLIRAKVMSTEDPNKRGRVTLAAPLWGNDERWAEVLRSGGGAAPAYKKGDVVIVGFEGGDLRRPIVLGAIAQA